jgi:hypothetical protein
MDRQPRQPPTVRERRLLETEQAPALQGTNHGLPGVRPGVVGEPAGLIERGVDRGRQVDGND